MDVESAKAWVTVLGVIIAAATGVWNLLIQIRGKTDKFHVGLGTVSPTEIPDTLLHVVSHSDHSIKLTDWGFIEPDGRFSSIIVHSMNDPANGDDVVSFGSSELASRGATFETGYERGREPFGAYAMSVTQQRPKLYFDSRMPHWRRLLIRLRLFFGTNYHRF